MSALTSLGDKRETNSWENQPFTLAWPQNSQQEATGIITTVKKQKRVRRDFTTQQILTLERTYSKSKYIIPQERKILAQSLKLDDKRIKIWFQNRRMKEKRESSDSSYDSSSESFTSESVAQSTSPPTQTVSENSKNDSTTQCTSNDRSTEHTYQLPLYYGISEAPQIVYGVQPHNVSSFYKDNNIYPTHGTHYYMNNMNYTNVESNASYNYYSIEMNSHLQSTHNAYYSSI
ncbi:unnamed protein product [Arctia plantaginis]|uniref:Homeobox domain-containing protein n=1 Tax=Arctia plantaginis TaxID=874455 RepID=A0A8S1ATL8_ARCPL|nr:unnamed protein product [Arctia plantaginis]